ncbi:MAG: T9SS type A sorting domain-containing protein, partial [Bacteroidota bacterium]
PLPQLEFRGGRDPEEPPRLAASRPPELGPPAARPRCLSLPIGGAVSGLFSDVVVTIRWLASYGVSLGSVTTTYGIAKQGAVGTLGSYSYQKFAGANNSSISWANGSENTLFTVTFSGGSGTGSFALTNSVPLGEWYFEIGGLDFTGTPPFYQDSTGEVPLPIQLSSFTATVLGQNRVRLDWTTLTETNNYGFEIQKSQGNQSNYQTIPNSFIPGHGTTIEPHSYSYVDNSASVGQWYYRLKQIDLDGTIHFTEGIQVDVLTGVTEKPLPKEFALDQNYPNPFNPTTNIEYAVPRESQVRLEVYNVLGQRVAMLVDEMKTAGYYKASFSATGFASGLYFYRMTAGEVSFLKKMMLVK